MSNPVFVEPTEATPTGPTLSDEQAASWRDAGFALVDGVFPAGLIERLKHAAEQKFPAPATEDADQIRDFGSAVNFPSRLDGFNELTLHPRLIAAVGQLLGRDASGLRLSQSDLWPKYGRSERDGVYDNQDQRIHFDYPNHTLAHPTPWDRPEAVEMICLLYTSPSPRDS